MRINNRQKIYWTFIESQVPRLVAQLDRNPLSKTYGSFDRKFWHQRFTDFSSASLQQGVETLAFLYQFNLEENSFYKNKKNLSWIEGAVKFTLTLQNKDGSFDEWYAGEHGWAGPTSYILNSLFQSYQYSGKDWSDETIKALKIIFTKALPFISRFEESHVLSNHQAIALLSLKQAQILLDSELALKYFEELWNRFEKFFHADEGWSLEYDGADPGYQTATLSFLARIDLLEKNLKIRSLIKAQLEFISYFLYPGGQFCEGLGSRSTANAFFLGAEYWSHYFDEAYIIAGHFTKGLSERKILAPQDQEDHYLIYRLPELAMALSYANSESQKNKSLLPYQRGSFTKHFSGSGHIIIKKGNTYTVIDSQFGGRYRAYSCKTGKLISGEGDQFAVLNKRVLTSGSGASQLKVEGESYIIETYPSFYRQNVFNSLTLIGFKIVFSIFSKLPSVALKLKSIIRNKLMYSPKNNKIKIIKKIVVSEDSIKIETIWPENAVVFTGYNTPSRYVPQSRYFSLEELDESCAPQSLEVIPCAE